MTDRFYVQIVEYTTGAVAKRMGPFTELKADRVDAGANVNLDHYRFFTRISDAKQVAEDDKYRKGE